MAQVAALAWPRSDRTPYTERPWRWETGSSTGSPLWVTTADLPTNAGHPFFERLNRVFRNLAEVRAAVAGFVERYNQCWRLEKLAYRTPLEAREEYELRHAA